MRITILVLTVLLALLAAACAEPPSPARTTPPPAATAPTTADGTRISGPYRHERLTIFLLHGPDRADTRTWLTLAEAMQRQTVVVHETGTVNQLAIENTGDVPVFVQSGDLVKGGRQDRVVAYDLVVAAKSPRIPLQAYCVEHGRWSGRAGEAATHFNGAEAQVNANAIKKVIKADLLADRAAQTTAPEQALPQDAANRVAGHAGGDIQGTVWKEVAASQTRLQDNLGAPVQDPKSSSSLQLTLEHERVRAAVGSYEQVLAQLAAQHPDAIGYAFAIDGRMNYADLYASHDLFIRLWPKLLSAAAGEAVASAPGPATAAPDAAAVQAWFAQLDDARRAARTTTVAPGNAMRGAQAADGSAVYESTGGSAAPAAEYLHRAYAK